MRNKNLNLKKIHNCYCFQGFETSKNLFSEKFHKVSRKEPMVETLFDKGGGFSPTNLHKLASSLVFSFAKF